MKCMRNNDEKKGLTTDAGRFGSRFGALLLLLMLLGGVSCDRTTPPEQKPAEAPPVTKLPLPQHGDQVAKPAPTAAASEQKGTAPSATAAPAATPAPPAAAVKALPTSAPPAKELPRKVEQTKKVEQKKVEAPTTSGKKPLPQGGMKEQKVTAEAKPEPGKMPVNAGKKAAPESGAGKMAAAKKIAPEKEKPAQAGASKAAKAAVVTEKRIRPAAEKSSASGWTIVVGTYLLEDEMAPDLAKVRKAGLEAAVKPGARKRAPMNRLFLGEYDDAAAAKAEQDKLKQKTSDAFILTHGGKHAVFAGSYLLDNDAASEKERLAAAGFSLTIKRVNVAIPSRILTAGSFDDRKAADEAARKLRGVGLKATVVRR